MSVPILADDPDRCAAAFRKFAWAFPFIALQLGLTFRFAGHRFSIDFLPDVFGYILIAAGASRLIGVFPAARGIRNLALALNYMAIPKIVQYATEVNPSAGLPAWLYVSLAWEVIVAILDLLLVRNLCGMVAILARDTHHPELERLAVSRRGLYTAYKLLGLGVIAAIVVGSSLIFPFAILLGIGGIVVTARMIGLMNRASRVATSQAMALHAGPAVADDAAKIAAPSLGIRLVSIGGVILPLLLLAGAFWYYQDWSNARRGLIDGSQDTPRADDVASQFLQSIEAGDFDAAYKHAGPWMRQRIGREDLEVLVRSHPTILAGPDAEHIASESMGGADGCSLSITVRDRKHGGKGARYTVSVRREDTLFHRRPPAPTVYDFVIQPEPAAKPDPPLDQPADRPVDSPP